MPYLLVRPGVKITNLDETPKTSYRSRWYATPEAAETDNLENCIAFGSYGDYSEAEYAKCGFGDSYYAGREQHILAGWNVEYHSTASDRYHWQERERARLLNGDYEAVPWLELLNPAYITPGVVDAILAAETDSHRFAHLSLKTPGKIAFTENDRKGFDDIQTAVTPGRYLQRFHSDLNIHQHCIERFCAAVGVHSSAPALAISDDPDVIEQIYRNGPSSCMDGTHDFKIWPTRVYGKPGDLAVAYLGNPVERVTARAVVWPDRKTYSRVYGNDKLRIVLERNGYTQGYPLGARVTAIHNNNRLVMPYVDGIEHGSLTSDRSFIVLDDEGNLDTQSQYGYANIVEYRNCSRCNSAFAVEDDNDQDLCASCYDDASSCSRCGDIVFDDVHNVDDGLMCDYCYRQTSDTCQCCGESFNMATWSTRINREREHNGRSTLCEDCATDADVQWCDDCGEWHRDRCECDSTDTSADDMDPTALATELCSALTEFPGTVTTTTPRLHLGLHTSNADRYMLVRRDGTDLRICYMGSVGGEDRQPYGRFTRDDQAVGFYSDLPAIRYQHAALTRQYPATHYEIVVVPDGYDLPSSDVIVNGWRDLAIPAEMVGA